MKEIKELNKKNLNDYYLNKKVDLSENAVRVLERRYLKRDEEGVLLEKPLDMFIRVARNIASAEKKYGKTEQEIIHLEKQFFNIMTDLDFLPNSPTLMNAGKELQQLAANNLEEATFEEKRDIINKLSIRVYPSEDL